MAGPSLTDTVGAAFSIWRDYLRQMVLFERVRDWGLILKSNTVTAGYSGNKLPLYRGILKGSNHRNHLLPGMKGMPCPILP